MQAHDDLFSAFAIAMRFPDYFGENWPALEDCLNDMTWFDETGHFLIVITNWPKVLQDAPMDRVVLRRVLEDVAKNWATLGYDGEGSRPVAFNVVALDVEGGSRSASM
jgi:hypothetical protein